MARNPASTGRRSTTSSSAAPTRPARTTATSRAWRCCWPACRTEIPGSTVNRLCGSGMDAVTIAARAIKAGEAELMIAGGVESMSRAPFVMPKADTAFSRNAEIYDTTIGWRFVNPLMKAQYGVDSMPETGENVAEDFAVSRADQDAFAVRSQDKAVAAQASGRLAKEITPVTIPQRKGDPVVVDKDEHPRAGTTRREPGEAADAVPQGRHGDGRQCVRRQRWRGGADRRLGSGGEEVWPDADRAHPRRRGGRRRAAHHGHRPGAGDAEAVRAARAHAVGFRRDRTQRGLRLAGHRGAAPARHRRRRGAREPQWRRDRARPSARHVGRAHCRNGGAGTARARRALRAWPPCASASGRASRWRWNGCEDDGRVHLYGICQSASSSRMARATGWPTRSAGSARSRVMVITTPNQKADGEALALRSATCAPPSTPTRPCTRRST